MSIVCLTYNFFYKDIIPFLIKKKKLKNNNNNATIIKTREDFGLEGYMVAYLVI